jgi:starch synthase/alpha-amylase
MGGLASLFTAKAGGLADVSAALISALFEQGADVHVAIPDYRNIFSDGLAPVLKKEFTRIQRKMPDDRIHLAEDRAFYYLNRVYSSYGEENIKLALAFQREVINNIVPHVQPDLIHCNDWMAGLIPAMARQLGIPCLFTIHNVHTVKTTLAYIEDRGIDAASFWQHLYYEGMAYRYEDTRDTNPVDLLTSGIFAAHFVNVVSPTFLEEIINGRHSFIEPYIRRELMNKAHARCAAGILNAPDPSFNPLSDEKLPKNYGPNNYVSGKKANKRFLQKKLGLIQDFHGIQKRVAILDFNNKMEHLTYGASDFILMPSSFEPCGLPQMIAPIYGTLPVAHETGGIRDTIADLDVEQNTGNGFLFRNFDSNGLFWAVEQAMNFYNLPQNIKTKNIKRIMTESLSTFTHANTAHQYIKLYEKMLQRPLIVRGTTKSCSETFTEENK